MAGAGHVIFIKNQSHIVFDGVMKNFSCFFFLVLIITQHNTIQYSLKKISKQNHAVSVMRVHRLCVIGVVVLAPAVCVIV